MEEGPARGVAAREWSRHWQPRLEFAGHGEGRSPVVHGDTLIVCWDTKATPSALPSTNIPVGSTGKSPAMKNLVVHTLVVEHEGKPQAIVSATNRVRGWAARSFCLKQRLKSFIRHIVCRHLSGLVGNRSVSSRLSVLTAVGLLKRTALCSGVTPFLSVSWMSAPRFKADRHGIDAAAAC